MYFVLNIQLKLFAVSQNGFQNFSSDILNEECDISRVSILENISKVWIVLLLYIA